MKKILSNNFLLFCLLFSVLYLILARTFNIYLLCPFHEITGLYCPGCGVTRMIYSFYELNFYQAFRYNPLLFIFSPFIIFLLINVIYSKIKKEKSIYEKIPHFVWTIFLVVLIMYWVLRNIFPFLAPTMV